MFAMADGSPYHPERFSREFQRKQEQFNRANPDSPLPRLVLHGYADLRVMPTSARDPLRGAGSGLLMSA